MCANTAKIFLRNGISPSVSGGAFSLIAGVFMAFKVIFLVPINLLMFCPIINTGNHRGGLK